jgi:hypothetical protein
MKIYTEEEVIKAYKIGHNDGHTGVFDCSIEELSLTPIELPSNEEVVVNACKNPIAHDFMNDRQIGFIKGAKWMKEQILNQTNNL